MPSPTLDAVSTAFVTLLTGVGSLRTVSKRSPEVPVSDPTPALYFPPLSGPAEFGGMAARRSNYRGIICMTYLDAVPSQQSAVAGSTVTLASIESAFTVNLEAIIGAIIANPTLSGAVVFAGAIPVAGGSTFGGGHPISLKAAAGGPIKDDYGSLWVCYTLDIPFIGLGTNL